MESLALFVFFLLLALSLVALATLILSLLARLGKVPPVVGYIALGLQFTETVFAYQTTVPIGNAALLILAGCAALLFSPGSKVRRPN